MRCVRQASVGAALTLAFASSGWYSGGVAQDPRSALDPITSAVMKHPITTSSATARDHFNRGQRELDLARFIDANAHFKQAVAADPSFAFAYLHVTNTACLKCALASMNRARSSSRWPRRKWSRAVAEDVVIGCFITALVIGSSAERGSCARAPEYQPLDANATVRAARTDACLTHRMVASVVGSVGER